jgi:hypothetical protein
MLLLGVRDLHFWGGEREGVGCDGYCCYYYDLESSTWRV